MLKYMRMGNKRIKAIWWILTIITVVTFVFLFGTAFDPRYTRKVSGAVAAVDGTPVSRQEYETVLNDTRAQFRRQYGADPSEEDQRLVEAQAWRTAVTQTLLGRQAQALGLGAHDAEVVTQLRISPPPTLTSASDLQTNGQFDPNKYRQMLANPNMNWSPFEKMVREQLPAQKLQERLAASLKLSQPELLDLYRDLTQSVTATAITIPPSADTTAPQITDADLDRIYEKYKNRMNQNERAQVELLQVPLQYSPEELRIAREQAKAIADRARKGEDFAALARDYSEGSGAQSGGVVNRVFAPGDFGPYAAQMAASQKDQILDPIEQSGRFIVFKVLDRPAAAGNPVPGIKVAQIVVKARMSDDSMREQIAKLDKVRARAAQVGLSKAATEAGLSTSKSPWFDIANPPQQMFDAPQAFDFAISHKKGDVSPVLIGSQSFSVVQVADRQAAGVSSKDEVKNELRQLAELEKRVQAAKPTADKVAAALAQGQTLEQAAATAGLVPIKITGMSRFQPDPRLNGAPEVIGALFGAPEGKVVGPIQTPTGWFFVRCDTRTAADTTGFDQQKKGQLSQQILSQRQQEFFTAWLASMRATAKVEDLRPTTATP